MKFDKTSIEQIIKNCATEYVEFHLKTGEIVIWEKRQNNTTPIVNEYSKPLTRHSIHTINILHFIDNDYKEWWINCDDIIAVCASDRPRPPKPIQPVTILK